MNNKGYSPFTPGSPVPVELLVGRSDQMKEMARYIKQALHKNQENAFLLGEQTWFEGIRKFFGNCIFG